MTYNDEFDLTSDELAALAALPREMTPGDMLEGRVVRALKEEGHLGSTQRRAHRGIVSALRIAAGIALFAGGVATGRYLLTPDEPARAQSIEVKSPTAIARDRATPVNRTGETVVAEREMWL